MELKKYIDETSNTTTTVPTTTPRPPTKLKLNCPHHNVKLAKPTKGFRWQGKVANWEACAERCRKIKDCQYWQYWGAQEQTYKQCLTIMLDEPTYTWRLLVFCDCELPIALLKIMIHPNIESRSCFGTV